MKEGSILAIVKLIYGALRAWLRDMATQSSTPVDDWMLDVLDELLGFTAVVK